ncbi:NAD(P)-dependent dehydrogenase (short-subunit alcohol dehydrogenase family) [Paenibacillus rhizosphaerae]|uniref:NAD(P)-dependent dehydrogenase (Short-subunit alcohol dehydrogenase family) n=1 Tax=Paenibacillus rhizosphaerae TaxID=297318 RepID=A0A839U0S4_9BACL|nr:SDR family oxidoreductase [Paenibacillus rhizosphaerae]MBB3131069.1 NAD(P)-dependent dehydrogenase (short-subunit alcohol dehydrogenase family) [Paenibacillus rhizosphaerae]
MKSILITGASSGIGKAAAQFFQQQGWNVIATMRSPEQETGLRSLERVLVTRLDVERKETIEAAVAEGIDRFGRIDVLLNNAGYAAFGAFEAATDAQVRKQFDVNVHGVMQTTRALLPHFRAQGGGTVINVSSAGGRVAFPLLSLYHASKWAVEGFSESLYYELAEHNIRVKLVEPGNVATDFTGRSLDLLEDASLEAYAPYTGTVMKKQLESFETQVSAPEHIAKTIYEAAADPSPRFRYIAGPDAEYLLDLRSKVPEEEFMAGIAQQFR